MHQTRPNTRSSGTQTTRVGKPTNTRALDQPDTMCGQYQTRQAPIRPHSSGNNGYQPTPAQHHTNDTSTTDPQSATAYQHPLLGNIQTNPTTAGTATQNVPGAQPLPTRETSNLPPLIPRKLGKPTPVAKPWGSDRFIGNQAPTTTGPSRNALVFCSLPVASSSQHVPWGPTTTYREPPCESGNCTGSPCSHLP